MGNHPHSQCRPPPHRGAATEEQEMQETAGKGDRAGEMQRSVTETEAERWTDVQMTLQPFTMALKRDGRRGKGGRRRRDGSQLPHSPSPALLRRQLSVIL